MVQVVEELKNNELVFVPHERHTIGFRARSSTRDQRLLTAQKCIKYSQKQTLLGKEEMQKTHKSQLCMVLTLTVKEEEEGYAGL
ncbi:unnamed protein product [Camellia sinensis]